MKSFTWGGGAMHSGKVPSEPTLQYIMLAVDSQCLCNLM